MSALVSGQALGDRFTLIRLLGRGGMAEVWLVRDHHLDEEVVAKVVVEAAGPDRLELLRRECRHVRRLHHPNIVPVHGLHESGGLPFITMAYVDGDDLAGLRGGSPAEIVAVLLPVADALAHAHRLGVVHRDLKVSNIIRDREGRLHLVDFGISVLLGREEAALSGGGSRYSASPQQLAGEPAQRSDDIYAFGVLLYELLAGHPPFWPDFNRERVRAAVPAPIPATRRIPRRLESLVSRLLEKEPADRPADMDQVREVLLESQKEITTGTPPAGGADTRVVPPPRVPPIRPVVPLPGRETARSGKRMGAERPGSAWRLAVLLLGLLAAGVLGVSLLARLAGSAPGPATREVTAGEKRPFAGPSGAETVQQEADRPSPVARHDGGELAPGDPEEDSLAGPPPRREQRPVPASAVPPARPAAAGAAAFARAMSDGLNALEAGELAAARAFFEEAQHLRPGAPQAADGLLRVDAAEKMAAITRHRESAREMEKAEKWREAARQYTAVVALDPTIQFAQIGQRRAEQRADLSERIAFHLAHPERLSADAVLAEATDLLAEASQIEPAGPRHQEQLRQLAALLQVASQPIPVVLESDNRTDVTIYKVGHLGRFTHHEMRLRPGTYTVVGIRPGYRDVRRQLRVVAGKETIPLVVRCEERF